MFFLLTLTVNEQENMCFSCLPLVMVGWANKQGMSLGTFNCSCPLVWVSLDIVQHDLNPRVWPMKGLKIMESQIYRATYRWPSRPGAHCQNVPQGILQSSREWLSNYFLITCSDWGLTTFQAVYQTGSGGKSLTARKHQANVGLKSASL